MFCPAFFFDAWESRKTQTSPPVLHFGGLRYHSGDIPKHPNQEELVWQITQARRREARLLYQRFRQEEEWQKMDEYRDMYNEYEALIEIFLEDEYIELEEELRLLGWHYFEVEEEFWD